MRSVFPVFSRLSVLLSLISVSCWAQIDLHGFGSIRLGTINAERQNPNIVGLYQDDKLSWDDESLFGLQTQSDLGSQLSFTTQIIGKGANDFTPEVTLAFLRVDLANDQQLRLGRISMPLFSQSDVQYVGYAHDYSRLPKATYWRFEYETADGLSYQGKTTFDEFSARYSLIWAEFNGNVFKNVVDEGVEIDLHAMQSLSLVLSYRQFELFGGLLEAKTEGPKLNDFIFSPSIQQAVANSGVDPLLQQEFFAVLSVNKNARYQFWGARWQYADWKFELEKAQYGIAQSIDAFTYSQYIALSRRFDEVIITVHRERYLQNAAHAAGLGHLTPSPLVPLAFQISQAVNDPGYAMNVLSLRYDFASSMALKADYFKGSSYTQGPFTGFSMGVDFVF